MNGSVWCEKSSSSVISTLPAWIIEYAWTRKMMDVLVVLGPPPWLEGDRSNLTLKDPCSIRVMAAESWMLIRAREIKHFEKIMEFLNVTHNLLPRLVTPIKHMKIMFGLRTLVIMWMLLDDQSVERITDKIANFFPDSTLQYQRSSRRHIELMQKAQQDFRNFAQLLTRKPEMRKNYIENMMEQQYGEHYIIKLEERLLHYLEELNRALSQPTYIDQVLKQSGPLSGREELIQQLFTCNSVSPTTALKKLLRCAMESHGNHESTEMCDQQKGARASGPLRVACRLLLEEAEKVWFSQSSFQSSWINREKMTLARKKNRVSDLPVEDDTTACLCTKHGKRMSSILQECSEEQKSQDEDASLMQVECTLPSPHSSLVQSSPQSQSLASSQHDSSSTNISLSLQLALLEQQVVLSQRMTSSQVLFSEESFKCFSQKSSNAAELEESLHPECSAPLVPSLLTCIDQPFLSQTSSSSTNISPFPKYKLTPKSSSTNCESSAVLTLEDMCLESSCHLPVSLSSSSSSSPESLLFSAAPALTLAESQNNAQVSLDSNDTLETNSRLACKPRLSLDTQAFFLMCKWLQPQVKLYKLNQNEVHQSTLRKHAPERSCAEDEEDENVFDVNLLYTDSESDPHDSDPHDPDYVPFKKSRYM